jgi:tetratricopeptide (TPR) repeat protein
LRGAELATLVCIDIIGSPAPPGRHMPKGLTFKAFFSYAHSDARTDPKLVQALTKTLEERVEARLANDRFEIWRDTGDLRLGVKWDPKIDEAIRASDVLLVLLTPKWIGSDFCRKEHRIFEEVEAQLGDGGYIAPLLARAIDRQEQNFTDDQRATWDRLKARQFKTAFAVEFLKMAEDARTAFIDELADEVEAMLDRRRRTLAAQDAGAAVRAPARLAGVQQALSKANREAERRHGTVLTAVAEERDVAKAQLEPILAELSDRNVPSEDVPQRLREAVDALRAKAAEPIAAPDEDAKVEDAIRAARAHLGNADAGAAVASLDRAMREDRAFAAAVRRQAALLEEKADIQRRSFDHLGAIASLERAVELDRDRVPSWLALGDARRVVGTLAGARSAFDGALRASAGSDRDASVALDRIGSVLFAENDRAGALAAYRKSLAIREALAARDAGDSQYQLDLAVSHSNIGDVLFFERDLPAALAAYRTAFAIREALVAREPANRQWQLELSVSHTNIGDVLLAQADPPGALAAYAKALRIREELVAEDRANIQWQVDLAVSHTTVGDALRAEGELTDALAAYRKALAMREAFAARDASNSQWQLDLSGSFMNIGDVLAAQGEGAGALAVYRKALAIREKLVAKDDSNSDWQRDLAAARGRIAALRPRRSPDRQAGGRRARKPK